MDGEGVVGEHPYEAGLKRHDGLQDRALGGVVGPRDPAAQLGDGGGEGGLAQPRPLLGLDRPLRDGLAAGERRSLVLERVELPVVLLVGDRIALPPGGEPGHLALVAGEVFVDVGQLAVRGLVAAARHGRGGVHDQAIGTEKRVSDGRPDRGVEEVGAVVGPALALRAGVARVGRPAPHAAPVDPKTTVTAATAGQRATQRRHRVLLPDRNAPPRRERGVRRLPGVDVHERGDR